MKKIYYFTLFVLITIISIRYIDLYYIKHKESLNKYLTLTNKIIKGPSSPRGRIYDRNGVLLVDNIGTNTIIYRHIKDNDNYEIATKINNILLFEPATLEEQKEHYMNNNNTDYLLTANELKQIKYRKLTKKEIEELILSRIQEDKLNYTEDDKKIITIYNLMNTGYSYDNKILKENVSDQECADINSLNQPGLTCEYTTTRKILFDSVKQLIGTTGKITKENKDYYLSLGYSLNDTVGLSYLEKEYDQYLKGTPATYQVNKDNSLTLLTKEIPGNDLYLTLDINIQNEIDNIIIKNLSNKDKYQNTKYYNSSYVIVSNPNDGSIIASTGISIINNEIHYNPTNVFTTSYTVGSVIKGASHTVGYQNNLIEYDKKILDSCVKLYQVPMKCSHKKLGYINDIEALKTSSNYFQFITAIKLTGNKYKNNMSINATKEHFDTYRNTFKQFGLGTSTGIDLEKETYGITGTTIADDLLLNLSIGQYDTYTPLQLTSYINTISTSGKRYSLHYLKEVKNNDKTIYTYKNNLLNTIEDTGYFSRIQQGFKEVVHNGTGRGYTDTKYKPAGKTGTAEVYYNKDINTINQTYAMYAPYDNPAYSIVVVSPNSSYNDGNNNYISPINRYISKEVSKLMFENFKIYDTIGTD
ncbi:MAG: penicillin-binding transpeptidase domain-containing protein [Candidatus Coprovivens sp.]